VTVRTRHAFLPFVAALGPDRYELLATDGAGTRVANAAALLHLTGDARPLGTLLAREERAALCGVGLDDAALGAVEEVVRGGLAQLAAGMAAELAPGDVLGLSCVFNQLWPSLAVAREVTARVPGVRVVLGGAEVQGAAAAAVLERFPFVTAVVRGRGERSFAALLERWRAGHGPAALPGVVARAARADRADAADDAGPLLDGGADVRAPGFGVPDYREFFETWRGLGLPDGRMAGVPVEASQGCSWGRCDFCGTDELVGCYRVRPAPSLGAEIARVVDACESLHVVFTDEALPPAVVRRALDGLPPAPWRDHLVFGGQGRADLRREHLAQLAERGLGLLQLGVESFSTALLRRMRKGVTGLENVRCLRWCVELGVDVDYNLILGHPGYDDAALDAMTALFPRLHHLPPPRTSQFFVNRYAPLFREGTLAAQGLAVRPAEQTCADLFPELLADFPFVALVLAEPPVTPAGERLAAAVRTWNEAWRPGLLSYLPFPRGLLVTDARGGRARRIRLRGTLARTLLGCDDPSAPDALAAALPDAPPGAVAEAVARLLDLGLLVEEDGLLLNVVPRHRGRLRWEAAPRPGES
jgi:ribosomal peptide maturation radical SAM protein 1